MGRGSKKKKGSSNNGRTGSSSSENGVKSKVDIWHGLPGGNPYEPGTRNHKRLQKTLQLIAYCLEHCKDKQLVLSMCPKLRSENPYPPDDPRCRKYYVTHFYDADRYIVSTQTEDDPELDERFAHRKLRESTEASPSENDVTAVKSRIVTSPPQNDLKPEASKVDGSPSEDGRSFLHEMRSIEPSLSKVSHNPYGSCYFSLIIFGNLVFVSIVGIFFFGI